MIENVSFIQYMTYSVNGIYGSWDNQKMRKIYKALLRQRDTIIDNFSVQVYNLSIKESLKEAI